MPPIPSVVNVDDDETRQLIEALSRRENDLVTYQIPRLRDCTESLNVQQRFATELREDLDAFTRQIEVGLSLFELVYLLSLLLNSVLVSYVLCLL